MPPSSETTPATPCTGPKEPAPPRALPAWLRRIGCISTTRADAGIYRPLLRALGAVPHCDVFCFAGGTHARPEYGYTIDELKALSDIEVIPVTHQTLGDGPVEIADTAGGAVGAFSRALARAAPDLVFVLGDRTEMLAAALAAVIHRIPIAHLHGGDLTEGAYDNQCRHAITKLAGLHFAAIEQHADRIRSMGEERWCVHAVGALALDGLRDFTPESPEELTAQTGVDFSRPVAVIAYHPETLADEPPSRQARALLSGLEKLDAGLLFIGPNADVGRGAIDHEVTRFVERRANAALIPSLPQRRFWNCLARAKLLIGNSSAGILEAASFGLPVVNIGDRQAGRLHPQNVINVRAESEAIRTGVETALDGSFRKSLDGLVNPYGDGHAAERIIASLHHLPDRKTLLRKRWPLE